MKKITIGELLQWGKEELRTTNLRSPDLDAEVLLMEALNIERVTVHVYPEREVESEGEKIFRKWIRRRKAEEPLQYITGKKEFMGLDFHVEKGVLIPRGDTEVVVEAGINILKELERKIVFNQKDPKKEGSSKDHQALRALEIGVGSGAIMVTLLYFIKSLYMVGTDISPIPLKVTKINGDKLGVGDRLQLLKGSLFEPIDQNLKPEEKVFDLIISNPPYIPYETKETLDREVKDFEPEEALFAKDRGLYFYEKIAGKAPEYLKKNGYLIFEIGYDQGDGVRRILQREGFTGVQILKDLENRDRIVLGKL